MKKAMIAITAAALMLAGCGQVENEHEPSAAMTETKTAERGTVSAVATAAAETAGEGTHAETTTKEAEKVTETASEVTAADVTAQPTETTTAAVTKPGSLKPAENCEPWQAVKINYTGGTTYSGKITLSAEDTQIIKGYCFSAKSLTGTGDCANDYVFTMENGAEICYHSDCGTFNDNVNECSYRVLDWMRVEINAILANAMA